MNAEYTKKAMKCCMKTFPLCHGCPLKGTCITEQRKPLKKALELIEHYEAEIESLNEKERILIYHLAFEREKAIKEFADELCKGRVSNDPVVIAVQAELNMMNGETKTAETDFPKDYSYGY